MVDFSKHSILFSGLLFLFIICYGISGGMLVHYAGMSAYPDGHRGNECDQNKGYVAFAHSDDTDPAVSDPITPVEMNPAINPYADDLKRCKTWTADKCYAHLDSTLMLLYFPPFLVNLILLVYFAFVVAYGITGYLNEQFFVSLRTRASRFVFHLMIVWHLVCIITFAVIASHDSLDNITGARCGWPNGLRALWSIGFSILSLWAIYLVTGWWIHWYKVPSVSPISKGHVYLRNEMRYEGNVDVPESGNYDAGYGNETGYEINELRLDAKSQERRNAYLAQGFEY